MKTIDAMFGPRFNGPSLPSDLRVCWIDPDSEDRQPWHVAAYGGGYVWGPVSAVHPASPDYVNALASAMIRASEGKPTLLMNVEGYPLMFIPVDELPVDDPCRLIARDTVVADQSLRCAALNN